MNVEIRGWEENDAEYLSEILNNRKILDNLRDGLPFPYTKNDALEYIIAMRNADKNDVFAFAITVDGKVAGSVGVFRQSNIHCKTAELGYYIGEKFWGNGVGTYAVKKSVDFVFTNSDIIRIFAEPFARNIASCRVLEKAGFSFEGTLHANAIKNGVIEDMKMYALIKKSI